MSVFFQSTNPTMQNSENYLPNSLFPYQASLPRESTTNNYFNSLVLCYAINNNRRTTLHCEVLWNKFSTVRFSAAWTTWFFIKCEHSCSWKDIFGRLDIIWRITSRSFFPNVYLLGISTYPVINIFFLNYLHQWSCKMIKTCKIITSSCTVT